MAQNSSNTMGSPGSSPIWLDMALIQKVLSSDDEDANVIVNDIDITRATAPGDNYASIIYRVNASLADSEGERSVLVKTLPEGELTAQALVNLGVFETEAAMIVKYIPAMKDLLEKALPGRFQPFAARCLLYGSAPTPFLVLEDLKPQGFRMAGRYQGLGLRHSLLAIRTLARFHAASAALLEKDPSIASKLPNLFRHNTAEWKAYLANVLQMTADECMKLPGYEEFAEILERFKENVGDTYLKSNDPIPGKFNVLLHGDFWTNNMMFRYDENGKLSDFRMVDLQVSHVASPAIDLLYFLNTSLSDDVWERHQDLLLREYHEALTQSLHLLGRNGPSFKDLMADMNSHGAYGLYAALGVWPVARTKQVPDTEEASIDATSLRFMYETATMRRWLQRMLPEFKRKGWLQF